MKKSSLIIQTSWLGIIINSILAIAKITLGLIGNSFSLIADGIDSASDIITYVISLIVGHIIDKKPDQRFSYGYQRAETIAAKSLSMIILFAGLQLLVECIKRLFDSTEAPSPPDLWITSIAAISIVMKLSFSLYQSKLAIKWNSSLLRVNALNMKHDAFLSFVVLISILVSHFFHNSLIDIIAAAFISIWILYSSYLLFIENSLELMDAIEDPNLYKKIFIIIESFEDIKNPHRLKLRKISSLYSLSFDIELPPDMSVKESHVIIEKLEAKLVEEIDNLYDIVIHVEPIGNYEPHESYGLKREDIL